jgi:molecular chaperone HtpG
MSHTQEQNSNVISDTGITDTGNTKYSFDADIQQLMHLIVHTFYSNRDIFLRELISNSSDALDKIRYNDLKNNNTSDSNYEIKINLDKELRMLRIEDTGVGMSKDDLLNNLGMIARSGTKNFVKALENKTDMNLIGQFGVGFYSVFLVADKVIVHSKKNDEEGYRWESDGSGSYFLSKEEKNSRGTTIELYMKEDALEYLDESKVRDIIKQHSQYIMYPLNLLVTKTREVEVEDEEESNDIDNTNSTDETSENAASEDASETTENAASEDVSETTENAASEDAGEDAGEDAINDEGTINEETTEDKPKNTITESYEEWEKINEQQPIWIRNADDIKLEEYNAFYKNLTNDYDDCLRYKHFTVEGQIDVKGLLYIPKRAPMDMFQNANKKNKIKLYVRRVFITDECENLVPDYMSFVSGLIDSNDLPLTVSREMLQQDRNIKLIKKSITKQVLNLLDSLSETEDYLTFYKEFSKNIKLGVHEDESNRPKLTKLLRFNSTLSRDKLISLDTYISNMKENQPGIYYITGENINIVEHSPFLEKLKNKNFEVLFMTDPIDEYVLQYLKDYEGKKLLSVTKVNLELGDSDDTKKELEEVSKEFEPLCKKIKEVLKTNVEDVLISNRIIDAPCCLVTAEYGWSANMERIMKAQTLANNQMSQFMMPKKTLELNPNNNMIKQLNNLVNLENDSDNLVDYYINILYSSSILDSGFSLENPRQFSENIYKMLDGSLKNIMSNSENLSKEQPSNSVDEPVEPASSIPLNESVEPASSLPVE